MLNLEINNHNFEVETAETFQEKEIGLGHRANLPPDGGMLFVFENDDYRTFWMDGMQFPIDIIWVDWKGEIVGVTERARPPQPMEDEEKNLPQYNSPLPCKFVLEINAGKAQEHGIKKGDLISGLPAENLMILIRKSFDSRKVIDDFLEFAKQMSGTSQFFQESLSRTSPKKTAAEEYSSPELHNASEDDFADKIGINKPKEELDMVQPEEQPPASQATSIASPNFVKQEGGFSGTVATSTDAGTFTPTFGGKHPKKKKSNNRTLQKFYDYVNTEKAEISDFSDFGKQSVQKQIGSGLTKKKETMDEILLTEQDVSKMTGG